jgi:hypothetical protein
MADGLAWDDLTPALEDPGVGIRRMDGAWGTLPEQPPRHQQKPRRSGAFAQWWGQDSNLRRQSQRVYSPSPLTAREPHQGSAQYSAAGLPPWRRTREDRRGRRVARRAG